MWRVVFARSSTGGRHDHRAPPPRHRSTAAAPLDRRPRRPRHASDEIAKDYCETRDVRRGLRAFARSGTTSAAYEAAANLALARALLVEAGTGRRDGEIDFDVDPVQVHRPGRTDRAATLRRQRAASGPSRPRSRSRGRSPERAAASRSRGSGRERTRTARSPTSRSSSRTSSCRPGRLADSGAPTEAVEEILDHVAALREGRG